MRLDVRSMPYSGAHLAQLMFFLYAASANNFARVRGEKAAGRSRPHAIFRIAIIVLRNFYDYWCCCCVSRYMGGF